MKTRILFLLNFLLISLTVLAAESHSNHGANHGDDDEIDIDAIIRLDDATSEHGNEGANGGHGIEKEEEHFQYDLWSAHKQKTGYVNVDIELDPEIEADIREALIPMGNETITRLVAAKLSEIAVFDREFAKYLARVAKAQTWLLAPSLREISLPEPVLTDIEENEPYIIGLRRDKVIMTAADRWNRLYDDINRAAHITHELISSMAPVEKVAKPPFIFRDFRSWEVFLVSRIRQVPDEKGARAQNGRLYSEITESAVSQLAEFVGYTDSATMGGKALTRVYFEYTFIGAQGALREPFSKGVTPEDFCKEARSYGFRVSGGTEGHQFVVRQHTYRDTEIFFKQYKSESIVVKNAEGEVISYEPTSTHLITRAIPASVSMFDFDRSPDTILKTIPVTKELEAELRENYMYCNSWVRSNLL